MVSVTSRINKIKQPKGGYIKPSQFEKIILHDTFNLSLNKENIHPVLMGIVVDYLSRFMNGTDLEEAFRISIKGYKKRSILLGEEIIQKDKKKKIDIESLINQIKDLDDNSIIAACKVCTYDVWFRNPLRAIMARGADETTPDDKTIENIRIMVNRCISFWKIYGPVIVDGFTFEEDGYSGTVNSGDGDYLTVDTLWDFKVLKSNLTSKHTLQLLMYWIMGQHSRKKEFNKITKIGIYNPRLNIVYLLNVKDISKKIIEDVEKNVICY